MENPEQKFKAIALKLEEENDLVTLGKMMSAPGIKFRDKVVAFFYKEQMVFRLGKDYDLSQHGISEFTFLNPFKNKPPMKGWYEISPHHADSWEELTRAAMAVMKKELEKK